MDPSSPSSQRELRQFIEAAEQIADVAGYDAIRLGWLLHEPSGTLLALSASLERARSETPALPPLRTGPVVAAQRLLPLAELNQLVMDLGAGIVPEYVRSDDSRPVSVQVPSNELRWRYYRSREWQFGMGTYAEAYGTDLAPLIPSPDLLDNQIAAESGYAYASLYRLANAYAGLGLSVSGQARFMLVASWPVNNLVATLQGGRLGVLADGLEEVDTSSFILNIEGSREDRKLDASQLRWQSAPGRTSGTRTYIASVEARDQDPQAVNLYVSRAPALSLRATVERVEASLPVFPVPDGSVAPVIIPDASAEMRLTTLRIGAFRLLRSAELRFEPSFVVIVGPNQSGKSSVLDALQLLSDAARGELTDALVRRRGGLGTLRSRTSTDEPVSFEAELQAATGQRFRYRLQLGPVGTYDFAVIREELAEEQLGDWRPHFSRTGMQARLSQGGALSIPNSRESLLSLLGPVAPPLWQQVQVSLAAIAVYPYFRTGAAWADPEAVSIRQPVRLEPGTRLDRTGSNLSSALFSMKEERQEDWQEFVEIVRLAFPSLKGLRLPAVTRGRVQLFWDDVSGVSFDSSELSDGTLSFLAILCALFQPGSALIAVEEPEQHLHPEALMRLVGAARSLSARQPILFTTQSDTLIGLLDDMPECIVVARREGEQANLVRPGLEDLREWLKSFSLRELRRELEQWGSEP